MLYSLYKSSEIQNHWVIQGVEHLNECLFIFLVFTVICFPFGYSKDKQCQPDETKGA